MPQPDTLAGVDFTANGPSRRSRRDFLTGTAGRRSAGDDYWIRVFRRAMACRFEITLESRDGGYVPAALGALNEVDRIESELSIFRADSLVTQVNRCAADRPVHVGEELIGLLERCGELHRGTDGAFDVTSTPLSRCWGFLQREGRVPSDDAIEAARACVGYDGVELDRTLNTVRFCRSGIEINLGAVGKGYALDRVASRMRQDGVNHALLSAGRSSLLCIGGRGAGWHVDVVSPRSNDGARERLLARVWFRDAAIGTSGAGEQFVMADGKRYGHVIDPRTGWPANGVLSASAITATAEAADALSTAFLIGGADLAEQYCAAHPGVIALVTPEHGSMLMFGEHDGVRVSQPS
jgi:thiamine biosynthesis lipoprotein